ncbi:type I-MYXAN CRISPR-associated protein Cas6/Cmx6 [Aminobacterium colombiense]|uniref:CRISPR-associated protein, Cas6-related protein n=1 Tax=Aminobacterium colombiense (strain DSM 12261 / ALA-1) TaxID=572547 RepID=D5ECJ4_AMICL|nr:type I-MYXAN CRISPR-associated protein Cas6/Cmx6 [Aminobacterium colombiense]ADE56276.1 CRISPR-associated protein, Cas6-related protein [Aminobacterium colombiense DSM 12261]
MVDLEFQLHGKTIDADHGYQLYSAITDILPSIHHAEHRRNISIHPINGAPCGERKIALNNKSRLTLRIPVDKVPDFLFLCGKFLRIGTHNVTVGIPVSRKLVPYPILGSRLVTIKGFTEPDQFLDAVQRQLDTLNILGTPHLLLRSHLKSIEGKTDNRISSPFIKRTLCIKDKNIVGFPLLVSKLTAEESLRLQRTGLGGRRMMGCGVFIPQRRE